MREPSYFLAVHGDDPSKLPVNEGVYSHHGGYIRGAGVSIGDVLLLYMNLSVSGIGVVTGMEPAFEPKVIQYQFFSIKPTVHWVLLKGLQTYIPELKTPLVFKGNWLQKITSSSFRKVIGDSRIDWP
jgi:hypothetical protein